MLNVVMLSGAILSDIRLARYSDAESLSTENYRLLSCRLRPFLNKQAGAKKLHLQTV